MYLGYDHIFMREIQQHSPRKDEMGNSLCCLLHLSMGTARIKYLHSSRIRRQAQEKGNKLNA